MLLAKSDIGRPARLLKRIQQQFASAGSTERRASLLKRHAAVEIRVNQLLTLVSMRSISDQIN